ncbi:MAG TPA: sialidase family protein [Actinomycetota bacterium]|nr:sialidase family protein [Actinomycetota bacterium]
MRRRALVGAVLLASVAFVANLRPAAATHGGDTEVSVGSNDGIFSQNKQNEPAVAIDPSNPGLVAAGANDNVDMEACNVGDDTTCPFTDDVGVSGIYFSFDGGDSWTQPTYQGLTARDCTGVAGVSTDTCTAHPGDIGTLPGYADLGIVSDGDPALVFGPLPGPGGFSWDNGSRLYYANLASEQVASDVFRGFEAIAVSRLDFPAGEDPQDVVADQGNWLPPVIVSKQSATTFSDKEQIWVDRSETSPFFGHVYLCWASFRSLSSGLALPTPLIVATSADGGETWRLKQVTDATNNPFNPKKGFGRSGCTIRTDSQGVVYVFANQFAVGTPGNGAHILIRSFDGGKSWTRPQVLFQATDACFFVDPVIFRCVMDGVAGARDDLSSAPSVDIASGAPTGEGATDLIYDVWVDGRTGQGSDDPSAVDNTTQILLAFSTDRGDTWSEPITVPTDSPDDRPYYAAVALSPDGKDAYVVYNAFTTPFRADTSSPRGLVGVVLHADVGPDGAPTGWTTLNRGAVGDPRASSQNNLLAEFLGDYVYAQATDDAAVAVWNDVRGGADCPAMDAWRLSLRAGGSVPRPAPQQDCDPTFGNTDIFGGSYADPTPD